MNKHSSARATAKTRRSGLAAIITKEFYRFFTDKRMILTTVLLPGLMIFAIYSVMGSALGSLFSVDKDYRYQVAAVNLPASLQALTEQAGLPFETVEASDSGQLEQLKHKLTDKDYDLLVVFPANFDATLAATLSGTAGAEAGTAGSAAGTQADAGAGATTATPTKADGATSGAANTAAVPDIELFYNSTRTESSAAYSTMRALLDTYRSTVQPLFTVNTNSGVSYDLVTEQDRSGFMIASMLPMLMMIFLFSGAMGVAPDSIAGEKERGTLATILVTPLKRWELALGKIVSLSCISLLGGASSFIGVMASLPNLLGVRGGDGATGSETSAALLYSATDYLMLLLVIVSTLLIFVGMISLLSALARSVKEAATLLTPLMILVMLIGVMGMFSQGASGNLLLYLIPVYNSVQCMVGIFSFTYSMAAIGISLVVNFALCTVCVLVLTKMFNSERIVFSH